MIIKPKTCQECHKNFATVRITKIVNGKAHELHLCQDCASKHSPYQKKMNAIQKDLNKILSNLLGHEKAGSVKKFKQPAEKPVRDAVCAGCGYKLKDYVDTYFLGCPDCYEAFKDEIQNDVRKTHGSLQHVGRAPKRNQKMMKLKRELEALKRELQEAIQSENFEHAAALRDKIRDLNAE